MDTTNMDLKAAMLAREEIKKFYGEEVSLRDYSSQFVDLFHKHLSKLSEPKKKGVGSNNLDQTTPLEK